MKKFTKFVLIFGSALFFVGLLLALATLALGGDSYLVLLRLEQLGVVHMNDSYSKREDRRLANEWDITLPNLLELDISIPDLSELDIAPSTLPKELKAGEYEIKNLEFDFGLGDVRIIAGNDFGLIYGNDNTRSLYTESTSGDTWIIRSNRVRWNRFWPWDYRQNDITLTVVLPFDFVAEDMMITMGAGNMQAENLNATKMLLDVGLGNCQVDSLNAEDATLNVGVGYLEARRFSAGQAKLEVALGSMEIGLTQPLTQYRYHVEVGLGSVRLGNNTYSGVSEVASGAEDAPYSLEINCGLGSVNVRI